MRYGVVLDEAFTKHRTPPGHPERAERITALLEAFNHWEGARRLIRYVPEPAPPEWIMKVHSERHFKLVRDTADASEVFLDPDTQTSPESFETALLAVGGGVELAERLMKGDIEGGFLLARPPGHHAEVERSMGFCLFNNVAIIGQWVLENGLASRVGIVDFDVHHGNGTQEVFYSRPDVLYISSHQYPFYPGTGDFGELGQGMGMGYTLNFPLRAGTGDSFFTHLYGEFIGPVLREYDPDLILVSAGFDGHLDDPLGGMLLSVDGYAALVSILNCAARQVADNRILYLLEGGYNLKALTDCVIRTIEVSMDPTSVDLPDSQHSEFEAYSGLCRRYFGEYWKCMSSP
jgi:acetoin utilization deacetylase AcuC-like enzyme